MDGFHHGSWLTGISQFALMAALGSLNEDESCPMNLTLGRIQRMNKRLIRKTLHAKEKTKLQEAKQLLKKKL